MEYLAILDNKTEVSLELVQTSITVRLVPWLNFCSISGTEKHILTRKAQLPNLNSQFKSLEALLIFCKFTKIIFLI